MSIGRPGSAGGFGLRGLTVQQCGHDLFCVDAVGGFFPDELQQAAQFVIRAGAIAGEATQQCEHILERLLRQVDAAGVDSLSPKSRQFLDNLLKSHPPNAS